MNINQSESEYRFADFRSAYKKRKLQAIIKLSPADQKRCALIAVYVIFQCLFVFVGSYSILYCYWKPEHVKSDFNKLIRIMYLYDYKECGYKVKEQIKVDFAIIYPEKSTLELPKLYHIASITPRLDKSSKLTSRTRKHLKISVALHAIWIPLAILLIIVPRLKQLNTKYVKHFLLIYFLYSVGMLCFDISMAIVYVVHIQQSLTKGMILRYAGWSVEITLASDPDGFGGWIPMLATIGWLRGIVFSVFNFLNTVTIKDLRKKLTITEVDAKVQLNLNRRIPEPYDNFSNYEDTLHFEAPNKSSAYYNTESLSAET